MRCLSPCGSRMGSVAVQPAVPAPLPGAPGQAQAHAAQNMAVQVAAVQALARERLGLKVPASPVARELLVPKNDSFSI